MVNINLNKSLFAVLIICNVTYGCARYDGDRLSLVGTMNVKKMNNQICFYPDLDDVYLGENKYKKLTSIKNIDFWIIASDHLDKGALISINKLSDGSNELNANKSICVENDFFLNKNQQYEAVLSGVDQTNSYKVGLSKKFIN